MPRIPEVRMAEPTSMEIRKGEQVAIVGENGAGKSMLVDLIMGKYPLQQGSLEYDFSPSPWKEAYKNIKHISFRDTFGSSDTNYYYQQRWNSTDLEEVPLVKDLLGNYEENDLQRQLFDLFHVDEMLDKPIILLSSGEMRKFQLTKMLLTQPRILILDNPYIGLDAATRDLLTDLLMHLAEQGIQLILVMSMMDSVPDFITHVVTVKDMKVASKMTLADYNQWFKQELDNRVDDSIQYASKMALAVPRSLHSPFKEEIVRLNKVSIRYGTRTILKDLDWVVWKGEKWALSGENGCGKSTLLSIICADNPQSYACDVSLFGQKRGTGESIWDIKKRIGYISPEMHRSYKQNIPALQIVASGLKDTIGLYFTPTQKEKDQCIEWMNMFGIGHLADRKFLEMSSGEQRLVLLARAFVKSPDLLILDEPLHGLDLCNRNMVKAIVDRYMYDDPDRTLIYVTHYENELPYCIDNSLYLERH